MSICRQSVGWRFKRLLTLSPFSEGVMLHFRLAELTGLEPATSAVTGQRSNQLSYNSVWKEADTRTNFPELQQNFKPAMSSSPSPGLRHPG